MTLFALLGQAACGHADRERWQQPDLVVRKLALHPGSRVADLGAGDGYFTLRLAVATGPAGRVYAIDIAQKRLDAIAAAAHERSIGNIETVLASEDGPRLTRPVDLIFICNTYHHLLRTYFGRA
jgi:precorrin-6B methylase 2